MHKVQGCFLFCIFYAGCHRVEVFPETNDVIDIFKILLTAILSILWSAECNNIFLFTDKGSTSQLFADILASIFWHHLMLTDGKI